MVDYNTQNLINQYATPSMLHVLSNQYGCMFVRSLLQKALSVFDWQLPETWNRDYFLYTLFLQGYAGIIKTARYGVIPQHGSFYGQDIFYSPKTFVVSNPAMQDVRQEFEIGRNCVMLKLEPDYMGIGDTVAFYAGKLALIAEDIDVNLFNAKMSYIFFAENKAAAESFKKAYDKIQSGEPAVVIDKLLKDENGGNNWDYVFNNLKNNYIGGELLDDMRTIENQFLTEIGIDNANTDKKERLISDEVNANSQEVRSRSALWLDSLQLGIDKSVKMFPELAGKFSVRRREDAETAVNPGVV